MKKVIRLKTLNDKLTNTAVSNPDEHIDRNRTHDLTIEEVKAITAFQHFTDQEAAEVIEMIKVFTKIVCDFYKKDQAKTLKF
jgi:hypothetical protein